MKTRVDEKFDISKYVTATDIAAALVAGVVAYIKNKPTVDDQQPQAGDAAGQGAPTEQPAAPGAEAAVGGDGAITYSDLQMKNGVPDFASVGGWNYNSGTAERVFMEYCKDNGIQCSDALAEKMFGMTGNFHNLFDRCPDVGKLITNPKTMSVLNQLAQSTNSDAGLTDLFTGGFWYNLAEMDPDTINQICASGGGRDVLSKLCDTMYGAFQVGKDMAIDEAEMRIRSGQIASMPDWHVGYGMITVVKNSAGQLVGACLGHSGT